MQSDNTFRTSDTAQGAYLVTSQFALLYIDYSKPRFEFVFPLSVEIQKAATKFISGNALVDPFSFARVNHKLLRIIGKRCQWGED